LRIKNASRLHTYFTYTSRSTTNVPGPIIWVPVVSLLAADVIEEDPVVAVVGAVANNPSMVQFLLRMDHITIKTPNPKCRLYWCVIEFTD
jgi:hypothetical protein